MIDILKDNCRHKSFTRAVELISDRRPKKVIEFGTMFNGQHEGWSTLIFARLSESLGFEFHSVDYDKSHCDISKDRLRENDLLGNVILRNECQFSRMSSDTQSYAFLYIDAADKDTVLEELTKNNFLSDSAIILIDDCLPGTQLDNMFKIINRSDKLHPILPTANLEYNYEEKKYWGLSKDNPLNTGILEYPTQIILEYRKNG